MATKKSRISALEAAIAEYEANLAQKESEKDVTPPSIEEDGEELLRGHGSRTRENARCRAALYARK